MLSYLDIATRLKRTIIRGALKPGQRMPTRVELERQFDTSSVTLNRAMRVLVEEGFVQARKGSATCVAPHPPHLSLYALAFPSFPSKTVSRFYEAIRSEAAKLQTDERRVSLFHGIDSHVDEEDYQRLLGWVDAQRLAGLIFAGNPYHLRELGSPLVLEPGVRRAAIMSEDDQCPFPTVYPDTKAFLPRAFDYLASRGRKRVAVVTLNSEMNRAHLDEKQALASGYGLALRPHWLQGAVPSSPEWSRHTALLLLHDSQTEHPDALVITDDNLVEGVTEGVLASGTHGAQLEVVAQANFPCPTRSLVPAKRLGYDVTRLLAVCLERIEQQRRGEEVPAHTTIPVVFEEELGERGMEAEGGKR